MRVLILCPHYLPGYRSGGPVRSVACLVDRLGSSIEFRVITHYHDSGIRQPYSGTPIREWTEVGNAQVMYIPDEDFRALRLRRLISDSRPDVIYLNSFFHRQATLPILLLRLLGLIPRVPIVLAPRGELSPGALRFRRFKKYLFISMARFLRLYNGITWQASSEYEKEEVVRHIGENARTHVFHISPRLEEITAEPSSHSIREAKSPGLLKLVYVGKVSRKKNFGYLIARLNSLGGYGNVDLDVFGRFESQTFERHCRTLAARLPEGITVRFHGPVSHHRALEGFRLAHLFFFPTLGENYGHVILESLAQGCPVLISNNTPWRNLSEASVGWEFPLEQPDLFESTLRRMLMMDHTEWTELSMAALSYAGLISDDERPLQSFHAMIRDALATTTTMPTAPCSDSEANAR